MYVHRSLISLKSYFGWIIQPFIFMYGSAITFKRAGQEESNSLHLDHEEEQFLVTAVTKLGMLRYRVLAILLLHTRRRFREICRLWRNQVKLGKQRGSLEIVGNPYILEEYCLPSRPTLLYFFH